ncbi:MAG: hypothetical protein HC913_02770 [Microscillaceae bacterium]|nr:hypothetical protein [Microscillaceae bacterium]
MDAFFGLLRLLALFVMLWACQPNPKEQAQRNPKGLPAQEPQKDDPENPFRQQLLGHWIYTDTSNYPVRIEFRTNEVRGDGHEEGSEYRLEGDKITYLTNFGTYSTKIGRLNEAEFVEIDKDSNVVVWKRDKSVQKK